VKTQLHCINVEYLEIWCIHAWFIDCLLIALIIWENRLMTSCIL